MTTHFFVAPGLPTDENPISLFKQRVFAHLDLQEKEAAKDGKDGKDGKGGKDSKLKEGDWRCPACNSVNFANRTACFKSECGKPKPPVTPAASAPSTPAKPADWVCSCGMSNRPNRNNCYRKECGKPKPPAPAAPAAATPVCPIPPTCLPCKPDQQPVCRLTFFESLLAGSSTNHVLRQHLLRSQ